MPHLPITRRTALAAIAATASAASGSLAAQTWPQKPITLVVPFAPGGATDAIARVIAKRLGELLGTSVVIDNKGGAGGAIACEYVAKAAPDGYTLLWVTNGTMANNLALYKNIRYDPLKDYVPLQALFSQSPILVVEGSKPFKTLAELVQYGKANPRKLNFGSPGPGSNGHLAGELFAHETGVQMTHVPYKGSGPAIQDMLAGRIDLMFDPPLVHMQNLKSGRVRALAVMSNEGNDALPGVPSISQAGYSKATAVTWNGIVAPAGTPPDVANRIATTLQQIIGERETVEPFTSTGSKPLTGIHLARFRSFIAEEQKKWAEVVRVSGATIN